MTSVLCEKTAFNDHRPQIADRSRNGSSTSAPIGGSIDLGINVAAPTRTAESGILPESALACENRTGVINGSTLSRATQTWTIVAGRTIDPVATSGDIL